MGRQLQLIQPCSSLNTPTGQGPEHLPDGVRRGPEQLPQLLQIGCTCLLMLIEFLQVTWYVHGHGLC